ncbi:hypothetical protein DK853_48875, partial [Klebsiella oxytoca]
GQQLRQVSFELGPEVWPDGARRGLIGGRALQGGDGGTEETEVFGIQSGIQSVTRAGETYDYRITVLYDLNRF